MAAINLGVKFNEESSGSIGFTLTGLDSEAVTPNSFSWTLTGINKVPINSRLNVAETPASTIFILLQGPDLAAPDSSLARFVTVKAIYNSTINGTVVNNLPFTEEYEFGINPKLNIPST